MATVRFSGQLIDEVLNNARKMFDTKVEKAIKNYPENWGDTIYETVFVEHLETFNKLPKQMFSENDSISVDKVGEVSINLKLPLSSNRPMFHQAPKEFSDTNLGVKCSTGGWRNEWIIDASNPKFALIHEQAQQYREQLDVVIKQRDAFVDSVDKVIRAHATLAPALKMWSALWDLIPQVYKDRHMEVVERTKKDVVLGDVDLNSLTATVTFNKLTKGV